MSLRPVVILPLLPLLTAAGDPQAAPTAFADLPNLTIDYYEVPGGSARAIRRALDAEGMTDAHDGKAIDARARWKIEWTWTGMSDGAGGCRVGTASVRYSAEVRMPRLVDTEKTPPPVLNRWNTYIDALERHEAGHLRYALEHIGDVQAALRNSPCPNADAAAGKVVAAIRQHDADYDLETRHGARDGATFP